MHREVPLYLVWFAAPDPDSLDRARRLAPMPLVFASRGDAEAMARHPYSLPVQHLVPAGGPAVTST